LLAIFTFFLLSTFSISASLTRLKHIWCMKIVLF
jgi:hypothetical protein